MKILTKDNIEEEFSLNEKVWVCQFGCPPFIGTISKIYNVGIQVSCGSSDLVYRREHVYHFPGDKNKLINNLLSHASDMERWASELNA